MTRNVKLVLVQVLISRMIGGLLAAGLETGVTGEPVPGVMQEAAAVDVGEEVILFIAVFMVKDSSVI